MASVLFIKADLQQNDNKLTAFLSDYEILAELKNNIELLKKKYK